MNSLGVCDVFGIAFGALTIACAAAAGLVIVALAVRISMALVKRLRS